MWSATSARTRIGLACAAASSVLLVCAGCGSGAPDTAHETEIKVTERDFHISAPEHVRPGPAVITVANHGPDSHELLIARIDDSPLPLRVDGMTVDEEAVEQRAVGSLEPGEPGAVRRLHVVLKPGRYELYCNMSGHYLGGMHTTLVVS